MRTPHLRNEIEAVVAAPWPAGCVIFSGKKQPNGYGRVSIDAQYRRAHVYACEVAHGVCPPGKREVGHSCGEPMCINPSHLRWVTRAENEEDKVVHGRSNRGRSRLLSATKARAIREQYKTGNYTQAKLAEMNGVHIMTINNVIHRQTWKHID